MKKFLLFPVLLCLSLTALPQKKGLYPTPEKALVTITLKNFEKKPVAKADLSFRTQGSEAEWKARTDKKGIASLLLPKGKTYAISVEDSANYNYLEVADKPYLGVRHTIFYHGTVNGKAQPMSTSPLFSMMPGKDGFARVSLLFINRSETPLPNEPILLTGMDSEKTWSDTTNELGMVEFSVPTGQIYNVGVKYNANFDKLNIPRHGPGAAQVRVKYGYIGSALIEQRIRQREMADSVYAALNKLDENGHHYIFNTVPAEPIQPEVRKRETDYGFDLEMKYKTTLMTPFYMEDRLYLGGGFNIGELYCVDPETGETCWGIGLAESGPSLIVGEDGTVVVITESCTIYAIDAIAGTLKWSKWLTPFMRSSPVVAEGRIYVAYEDRKGGSIGNPKDPYSHSLACFDLETGDICWQQWLHEDVVTAPVVKEGKLYCTTFDGHLYRMNAQSGEIENELAIYATSSPTVVDSRIFLSYKTMAGNHVLNKEAFAMIDAGSLELVQSFGETHAAYLDQGKQAGSAWSQRVRQNDLGNGVLESDLTPQGRSNSNQLIGVSGSFARLAHQGSKVVYSEGMIFSVRGNQLVALDARSGLPKWQHQLPGDAEKAGGFMAGPPAIAGQYLISANQDGSVWILDKFSGKQLKSYQTNDGFRNRPVVMDGRIYAPGENGKLCVIETGKKDLTGCKGWEN